MPEPLKKEDIKEAIVEAFKPFANSIKADLNNVDVRFNKIDTILVEILTDLKEAREERQRLQARINETYNAVDGFIKVVDKLETEFEVIKEDLNRIKQVIKEKLGVDLD